MTADEIEDEIQKLVRDTGVLYLSAALTVLIQHVADLEEK